MSRKKKSFFLAANFLFLSAGSILLTSCFGGGGDGVAGNSTVQGTVGGFKGTVTMRTTKQVARPASDGLFVFSGVPAGSQVLDFTQAANVGLAAGETASLSIEVPDDSTVTIGRVTISGRTARANGLKVEAKHSQGADDPANHDAGDDKGEDDPATHDVGDDHGVDDPATHDVGDDHGDTSGKGKDSSGKSSDG